MVKCIVDEGRKFRMKAITYSGKFLNVLHDKVVPGFRPMSDFGIASINHVIGFCKNRFDEAPVERMGSADSMKQQKERLGSHINRW